MNLLPAVASGTPTIDVIHHCDALTLMRALPDNSIDCVVTSPPYDDLRTYGGNWSFPFEVIAHETYRVLKIGGVLVWVIGDMVKNGSESLSSMRQALYFVDMVRFRMHDTMIYYKDGAPFPESNRYLQTFEYMFVLSKDAPKIHNLLTEKTRYGGSASNSTRSRDGGVSKIRYAFNKPTRIIDNVWRINNGYMKTTKDIEAYQHPAMFPEELARRHILTWTNPGDTVLDMFAGSGTTCKVARNLGRHYIGCDLNLSYVEMSRKRLKDSDPFQSKQITPDLKQLSLFEGIANVI